MPLPSSPGKDRGHRGLGRGIRLGVAIACLGCLASCLPPPAQAHKTEVSGDVAGIWHLEPNHSPKAGEPAQVWIALTQAGGKVIPLKDCDCHLTVYAGTSIGTTPLLEPTLQAIAAEQYQGIPGATLTFPAVGQYYLHLAGKPQAGANFQPFALSYTVTVAAGQSPPPPPVATPLPNPSASPPSAAVSPLTPPRPWAGWFGVGILMSLALILLLRRPRPSP